MFGKGVDHDNIIALRDFEYAAAATRNSEVVRQASMAISPTDKRWLSQEREMEESACSGI